MIEKRNRHIKRKSKADKDSIEIEIERQTWTQKSRQKLSFMRKERKGYDDKVCK